MEDLSELISMSLFAAVKFLFAMPVIAAVAKSVLVSVIFGVSGGWLGMLTFYYSSDFFMKRAARKREEKLEAALAAGKPPKMKKKFTRINKAIVKVKMQPLGMYIIALLGPVAISIPVSAIIVAKFYSHQRRAPFVLCGSVLFWALVFSFSITYASGKPLI